MHLQINNLTLILGSRSHKTLFSTLFIMYPINLQSLQLLHPTVKEEMLLQENTSFDLDLGVKVTQNVAECPLNHVFYQPAKFAIIANFTG